MVQKHLPMSKPKSKEGKGAVHTVTTRCSSKLVEWKVSSKIVTTEDVSKCGRVS